MYVIGKRERIFVFGIDHLMTRLDSLILCLFMQESIFRLANRSFSYSLSFLCLLLLLLLTHSFLLIGNTQLLK